MGEGRDSVPGFAEHLRAMREAKGMSQGDLARAAGTHPTTVSKLELGLRAPSFLLVLKLAAALKASANKMVPPGFDANSEKSGG